MFSIIISIVLFIVLFIALGFDYQQRRWRLNAKQLLSIFGLIPLVFASFVMVNANRVGVLFDPLSGGVQDNLLQEGLQIKAPYQTVYELNTEVYEITFDNISVQTSESQWVKTQIQIQVSIDKNRAFDFFKKHRDKDFSQIQSILKSTTQKELEIIATGYSVYDVLGASRADVINQAAAALESELIKDGIILHRLILVDTDAGEEIEAAIAREAALKKEAEAAQWLRTKAEEEGAAKVIEAEKAGEALVISATKEGEALVISAQKQKEANELLTQSLTPEVLEKMRIDLYSEKWDGVLPLVVSGDGSGLIIDISGLDGIEEEVPAE